MIREYSIKTSREEFVNVTGRVQEALRESGVQ